MLRHRTLILQEANFFFAYDTNKRLCLLFATSLRVNKHIDCLLGSSGVYLKYQGRENLKKSSVVPDAAQAKVEEKGEAASPSESDSVSINSTLEKGDKEDLDK